MRLIDADALHDSINKETYRHTYIEQIHSIIDNTPTIDAEPVKQGKWEIVELNNYNAVACSECGEPSVAETPYCSYCGADMRGNKE